MFKPLHKLKFLAVTCDLLRGLQRTAKQAANWLESPTFGAAPAPQPELVISQVPHLQVLVVLVQAGQRSETMNQVCGTTRVIDPTLLLSRNLATVKKIGPLLRRTNYASYFIKGTGPLSAKPIDSELLHYLVKELKLDINCNTLDDNPFVADLLPPCNKNIPVSPSIISLQSR